MGGIYYRQEFYIIPQIECRPIRALGNYSADQISKHYLH